MRDDRDVAIVIEVRLAADSIEYDVDCPMSQTRRSRSSARRSPGQSTRFDPLNVGGLTADRTRVCLARGVG